MECLLHEGSTAVGVCQFCGRGVCRACRLKSSQVVVCSEECERASALTRKGIAGMVQKSLRVTLVTAWFCWIIGGVFLACGVVEAFAGKNMLAAFLAVSGAIFVAVGFAYAKSARSGG